MKNLSIVCEEKYDPIAMVVAQHYAIESKYQMHIGIITPKQYLQENSKDGIFNEGWLLSIGKNECTSMYEHLIPNEISEKGFFTGVSGHIAIAYHDIDLKTETAKMEMKRVTDYFESFKKWEGNKKEVFALMKDVYKWNGPLVPIVFTDIKDSRTYIDLCMTQRATDELLASEAKDWLAKN